MCNWTQTWQFRQLWHLFDIFLMFLMLVNDRAHPADDSAVILAESTCIWESCKKHIMDWRRSLFSGALSGAEWSEREPEKCPTPAFMNHICNLVRRVPFFGSFIVCVRVREIEISLPGIQKALKCEVREKGGKKNKALHLLIMDKKKVKDSLLDDSYCNNWKTFKCPSVLLIYSRQRCLKSR